ncbi:hypothetical protein BDN71DRAFT_525648 [Pleurotus eryngii]|uniref:Uncharacterized protein n=1 Tax=Pleurotus eryngii TaxID=5323 RepID=A0A9P5ZI38_PLEER|nr:hypothetical protein BDN71DRAFT_525648 [Pleurotus eryngii]
MLGMCVVGQVFAERQELVVDFAFGHLGAVRRCRTGSSSLVWFKVSATNEARDDDMTDHIDCEVDAERAQLVLPLQVHAVCVPSGKGEYICARRRGQDLPGRCLGYITTPWTGDDRRVVICVERAGMIVRARKGTRWRG